MSVKPGLHTVATIVEYASDVAPKGILRLSIHRLQIFLVKYEYLRSLQQCKDQGIPEKLKNVFAPMCLRSLRLLWRPGLTLFHACSLFEKISCSKYVRRRGRRAQMYWKTESSAAVTFFLFVDICFPNACVLDQETCQ